MEQIFENLKEIEKKISCFLSDDDKTAESIMIENAAMALEYHVSKYLSDKKNHVLIMCGSGNNGADGYTLARRLIGKSRVNLLQCEEPKTFHCIQSFASLNSFIKNSNEEKQFESINLYKFEKAEIKNTELEKKIEKSDVIVDCIFGTGFHGTVSEKYQNLFKLVNHADAKKIACDIPSGLSGSDGLKRDEISLSFSSMTPQELKRNIFYADKTVSMGAYKPGLFADYAKDAVGKIVRAPIGVSDELFFKTAEEILLKPSASSESKNPVSSELRNPGKIFLLEKTDAKLPLRKNQNSHKGNFGHTCVISGTKCGAAILSAEASLKSGAGLASIFAEDLSKTAEFKLDPSVMIADEIPQNVNSFVLGPGFGRNDCTEKKSENNNESFSKYLNLIKEKKAGLVLDADSFYYDETVKFLDEVCSNKQNLKKENSDCKIPRVILTPHPKEFSELLKRTGFGEYSVKQITDERLSFAKMFSKKYPCAVLILKGANTIISQNGNIYICTLGSPSLSKAGSGDVLTGILSALLAQGYSSLDAAVSGVIMHSLASCKTECSYSQTAEDLIRQI